MRVFMRVRVRARARACVCAYSSRVKRHSVLRGARKLRGRLYTTRIFIRRILCLAGRLFASLPANSAVFYGLHIRNPSITQLHYSFRRRDPAAFPDLRFAGARAHDARNAICPSCTSYVCRRFIAFTAANTLTSRLA